MQKETIITTATILLIAYTLSLSALSQGYSAGQATRTFSSSGSIQIQASPGIGIYSNSDATIPFTSVSWGTLQPGGSQSQTVYVKNEGGSQTVLGLETSNWNSANAQTYLDLTWDYNNAPLAPDAVVAVTLTLNVDSNIEGVTSFSFDITITAT